MPNIKHICISDLHLGAPTSLLTDTPAAFDDDVGTSSDTLRHAFSKAFVATLAALNKSTETSRSDNDVKDAPCVILLGDIFDLSLGTPQTSIDTFDAVLKSLSTAHVQDQVGSFVFVPGNHDHELWTATRFHNMVGASIAQDRFGHTTKAFADPTKLPRAVQIDDILRNNGFSGATTFYPNMGLVSPETGRLLVLHHGHFIEPIYRLMSTLTMLLGQQSEISLDAETLEELNSNWIDFVWSNDGDNGRLGAEIMRGYHKMTTGGADIQFFHKLAHILSDKLLTDLPLPQTAIGRTWTEAAAQVLVDTTLGKYGQMERFSYQDVLGADSLAGLKSYLTGTVLKQVSAELSQEVLTQVTVESPNFEVKDMTFVFGHTHKPFETRVAAPGFLKPPAVYNTGGWDLDTPMFGTRLGAAMVFIDDELNTASLRLCDVPQEDEETPSSAEPSAVRVETADGTSAGNPMAEALEAAIKETASHWQVFTTEAAKTYRVKQAYIMALAGLKTSNSLDERNVS